MASAEVDKDSITLADLLGLNEPDAPKVKKSKKKRIDRFYSEDQIQMALHEIEKGTSSLRKAAVKYNVPRSTLVFRRSPKFTKIEKGPRPILTKDEEHQLVTWILEGEKYGASRRYSHIQEWVQKLLSDHPRENVPFPDNKPGRGWMKNFLKRHPELDSMKSMSFEDHCETSRANVKKLAMGDVSPTPTDIISQSIADNELVDKVDVASLRRAIYRARKKTLLESVESVSEFKEPLTADAVVDDDYAQVMPKLEIVDPAYEQEAGHSQSFPRLSPEPEDDSNWQQEGATEMEDTKISSSPLTTEDLNILPEPADEEPEFDNDAERAEPVNKRIKVEPYEYHMGFPSSSSMSFCRAESGQSNESSESRQAHGNSSQNSDDVEYVTQAAMASSVKPKPSTSNLPGPNAKPLTRVVQERDRCSIFGEYVAAKLRSLNTDAARNRVECLIANILYEGSRGKFDNSDPTSDIISELQSFLNSTKDLQTLKSENCTESRTDLTTDRCSMDLNIR